MAGLVPVYIARVRDTSSTTGTGTWTLSGTAPTGFQNFSGVGNGNLCYYAAWSSDLTQWETGLGTYSSAGPTLSRAVKWSSNANALVNFTLALTIDLVASDDFFNYAAQGNPGAVALAMIGGI